jgi:hypothetical protein
MNRQQSKAVAKAGQDAKRKHERPRRLPPRSRRHCTGAGIVDMSGRWQPRVEDY